MNLLERVLTLLRANLNTVVEKSDDPEKVLRQLQLDMRNQLVQVKTQVATAIAQGHTLQSRSKEKKVEAETWLRKAEQAIQQNNDDVAREALTRYNTLSRQSERYKQQQSEQEQLVITMRSALRQLEAKLSEVETTIDLLVARKRNALLQQRVFEALNKTDGSKDKEKATKAQDAVLEAEARAMALADLHKRNVDDQLSQLSEEQLIEKQLRDLKSNARPARETPLLQEGNPQPSSLLPPQPQNNEPSKKRATIKQDTPSSASTDTGRMQGTPLPYTKHEGGTQEKELDVAQLKKLMEQ